MEDSEEAILLYNRDQEARKLRRKFMWSRGLFALFIGLILGVVLPFIFTGILHLIGFGSKGIVPGSIASEIQKNLGNVTKNSAFACKFFKNLAL